MLSVRQRLDRLERPAPKPRKRKSRRLKPGVLTFKALLDVRRRISRNTAFDLVRSAHMPSGCDIWLGERNHKGYGRMRAFGRKWRVHRLVYTLAHGEIKDGLYVMHACDQPSCIRLDHLRLGTNRDNQLDASAKGRSANQFTKRKGAA